MKVYVDTNVLIDFVCQPNMPPHKDVAQIVSSYAI